MLAVTFYVCSFSPASGVQTAGDRHKLNHNGDVSACKLQMSKKTVPLQNKLKTSTHTKKHTEQSCLVWGVEALKNWQCAAMPMEGLCIGPVCPQAIASGKFHLWFASIKRGRF